MYCGTAYEIPGTPAGVVNRIGTVEPEAGRGENWPDAIETASGWRGRSKFAKLSFNIANDGLCPATNDKHDFMRT